MSNNKFLEKKFNVAAVRVSTNDQDCDRQKEILANLAHNLGFKYDLWLEDKGQKRGCIERDSFKKLEEISLMHPDGFNLWYSDATRFGTYELWEKQKNEFFIPHNVSIFTPNMLWDICFPETITERVMTTCLFALATDELESLSKRIKGKHESMVKMGLVAGNVPWLCDVRREDLFGNHILTWRETISRMKSKRLNEKINHIVIMPNGEIKIENPPKHDKTKDIQRLCLTSDQTRIDVIWYIFNWCQEQKKLGIGYTWNQLANELSQQFVDSYGLGWTSGRCRDLIINPACIGLPILGKNTKLRSPTMFFRNKDEPDGFERNRAFRSGKSADVPKSNWVQPDKPLFDLLPVQEWIDLQQDILSLECGQKENIEKTNKIREDQGLRKLCRPTYEKKSKNWLNDFVWDEVHNCQFVSGGRQVHCIVLAENVRYKQNRTDACMSFSVNMLTCILKDYFRLPFWQDYNLMNYKTETALEMQNLIDQFVKNEEKEKFDFESLYSLVLDRANSVIVDEIKTIDEHLFNMYRFIGKESMPTLKQKVLELENKKIQLEKEKKHNLLPKYQLEKKNLHILDEALSKVRAGIAVDTDLQLIMNKMNVKIHLNCKDKQKYVMILSSVVDAKLEVSEEDYQKFYRARFYPWAKGKEFDYLAGKYYDGSMKTKKKNLCPSMIARTKSRQKRQKK